MYFVLRPKLKATKEFDYKTEEQNKILQQDKINYEEEIKNLQKSVLFYNDQLTQQRLDLRALETKQNEIKNHTEEIRQQLDKDNEIIYQTSYNLMQEKLDSAAQQESQKYQQATEEAKANYLSFLEELAEETSAAIASKVEEIHQVEENLANMRAKADAAIAAAKREEEKLLEIDKYKILVTEADLLEINRLREIAPYFRNARAIYKIIWESYYRNLTTEMINRVIGTGTHTGIYKLTNTKNQKIYIGQAVELGTRWKEHIKCGLGIDTPNNILYKAMLKDGVENFTFEVLEECDRSQLNDREKYYIDFYKAQEWGYNMSKGGARN